MTTEEAYQEARRRIREAEKTGALRSQRMERNRTGIHISPNVIDQAHATRKLLFSGFVVLGVWITAGRFSSRRMLAELFARA